MSERAPDVISATLPACNICGAALALSSPDGPAEEARRRETPDCTVCKSTVRLRALIALLAQEIFGAALALPEFPVLKGIRGLGMSDSPELAERLAEKFDYTNTFYHQAPMFDATNPDERNRARYDFVLSSEVLEHVPPPVERAFQTLYGMLKPDGLLLMTTPYSIGGKTVEHFSDLHEFTLAAPGGKLALVNRRRDGGIEVFEDLTFHGGHGSTLEMRLFSQDSLRAALLQTGFDEVDFSSEEQPDFAINYGGAWSLPIAARKGHFRAPAGELAGEYREMCRLAARKIRDLEALTAEYHRHSAFHSYSHAKAEQEVADGAVWVAAVEAKMEERTRWAQNLERENEEVIRDFDRVAATLEERTRWAQSLERENEEVRREFAQLAAVKEKLEERLSVAQGVADKVQSATWTRIGRKLGAIKR
jgi:SAM-dependent methyltransferase